MATSTSDDDYAADPVPADKRIAWPLVFFAQMGGATSLFFMQMTSVLVLNFGSRIALISIVYASVVGSAVGFGICRTAIKTGFGTNVLARRVLGFRGAGLCSIMLATNGFVYFAVEATIMGTSLKRFFPGLALWCVLPVLSLGMIPLIWFGMRVLAKLQLATFFLYLALLGFALYRSILAPSEGYDWLHFVPLRHPTFSIGLISGIGTMNSVIFISGMLAADYTRFARVSDIGPASLISGIGFQLFCYAFSGLLGLWFGVRYMDPNPGAYFVTMLGGWGTVFAIATQLRINLFNMYGGSIAFLNVLRQFADIVVSRHLTVALFGVAVALVLMFGLMSNLSLALNIVGMFTTCFTCLVLVDVFVLRPLTREEEAGGGTTHDSLPDWQWPAVGALVAGTTIGCVLEIGVFGPALAWLASLVAALCVTLFYACANRFFKSGEDAVSRSA
jgi:purine-cytosine permease-like protein